LGPQIGRLSHSVCWNIDLVEDLIEHESLSSRAKMSAL